jgi:hypothetical protein
MRPAILALTILLTASFSAEGAIWYVSQTNESNGQDGLGWLTAFTSIQAGVDAAVADGDDASEVWVGPGVYTETVTMAPGVDLYGGFAANHFNRTSRDLTIWDSIIDGEDLRQCVFGSDDAILDGFIMYRGATSVSGSGGGMANVNASPVINNCRFIDNNAGFGGAISNSFSMPTISNCVFTGNSAGFGLVLYNLFSTVRIVNSTFVNNTPDGAGSGMLNFGSTLSVVNTILWNNGDLEIESNDAGPTDVSFSIVQMSDGGTHDGQGNLNADPLFFDGANADFRLRPGSPAINTGTDIGDLPLADIRGFDRPQGAAYDIGAYEYMVNDPTDTDGDHIPDNLEDLDDPDGDGIPNFLDEDSDGNGVLDRHEGYIDTDLDGIPNYIDLDNDGNGISDIEEGSGNLDDDDAHNVTDIDNDGDGIPDFVEGVLDVDGDGTPNFNDFDSDGDGLSDLEEGARDIDGDGIPNYLDLDSDEDGIEDYIEEHTDSDGDGIMNVVDVYDDVAHLVFDTNNDALVNATDIQLIINAVLGN